MQVFTISQKASAKKAKLHLVIRLFQAALFMLLIAGALVAIIVSPLSLTDCFAVALAILPTGWGLISVSYLTTGQPCVRSGPISQFTVTKDLTLLD